MSFSIAWGSVWTGGGGDGGRWTILIRGVFEFERGEGVGAAMVTGGGGIGGDVGREETAGALVLRSLERGAARGTKDAVG